MSLGLLRGITRLIVVMRKGEGLNFFCAPGFQLSVTLFEKYCEKHLNVLPIISSGHELVILNTEYT